MKQLFYNGTVITMDGEKICKSFTVEDGRFSALDDIQEAAGNGDALSVNLHGQTVMPAFIDAHSHLSSYANSYLQAQLGDAGSFEEMIDVLRRFAEKTNIQPGGWIIGSGYDHNAMKEKTHPTKQLLDESFPGTAIVLQHKSRHFGVFSSTALSQIGFEGKDTNGYLEENEFVAAIKKVPMPDPAQMMAAYQKAMDCYASYGITTVQEGMMVSQMLPMYRMLLQNGLLSLDVVGYPHISDANAFYSAFPECDGKYHSGFRLGGYKIILDGSPQGRTAWMKTAYLGSDATFGVSAMTNDEVLSAIKKSVEDGRQLLAHCNGDAAVGQFISAAEQAADPEELQNIRPVIIHGQLIATDQLLRIQKLGMIPSFFVAHCYYWGDTHIENFGYERAAKISPANSALETGILFTFHQDTPVIEPNMLETIWCAVSRKTKSSLILGESERISVYEALKAVTINAAYQYGEESDKGSIVSGKKADFILLSENPFTVPPDSLKNISIRATYKSGVEIYRNSDP